MGGQAETTEAHSPMQDEKDVKRISEEWVDALIRGDLPALNRFMDENCVFTYALEGEDRAQFLSEIQSGSLKVASLKRDNVEVRIYGATGVITSLDAADWLYGGRRIQGHYRTMQVYTRRGDRWEIVAIQASPISSK
ncbi:MAG TPA: nuclear transport factor 2 family protein [Blastocatellia bacterium]|nr:nuclear transport factor 2 family protein [Blastocatellia bacterium]